nr:LOB domain-containing protein 21-like [Ipomoea batatas]
MKNHQEPRSSSSCAACKFLKRRCVPNCQFAPYFRSDEPKKFAKVHKVFGASNVSKILNEVPEEQREDTVNSLVYEAEVRLRDPVYGCIGAIASLQRRMAELQNDLVLARARLAFYATANPPTAPASSSSSSKWHTSQMPCIARIANPSQVASPTASFPGNGNSTVSERKKCRRARSGLDGERDGGRFSVERQRSSGVSPDEEIEAVVERPNRRRGFRFLELILLLQSIHTVLALNIGPLRLNAVPARINGVSHLLPVLLTEVTSVKLEITVAPRLDQRLRGSFAPAVLSAPGVGPRLSLRGGALHGGGI